MREEAVRELEKKDTTVVKQPEYQTIRKASADISKRFRN